MSQRLLIAIADRDLASAATALAAEVRLALLRPGEEPELKKKQRVYVRPPNGGQ